VLIERGSEVGGGDTRFGTGTVARIVEAAALPDGQWLLATVGTRRFRVQRWLPDDPYPQADVEERADLPPGPDAAARQERVESVLRRVLALRAELGEGGPPATAEIADDPAAAVWQAALLAGLSPVDALRLLEEDRVDDRLDLLARLLDEEAEILALRLSGQ
jgi:Lon protease-like protein